MAAKSLIINFRLVDRRTCVQEHTIARENVYFYLVDRLRQIRS